MPRRFIVTGAPGSGKTALLNALQTLAVIVAEPARELIAEHRAATGETSLDERPQVFVDRLVRRSIEKFEAVAGHDVALFDRGLPDCVAYAAMLGVDGGPAREAASRHRYDDPAFILPPWEDIYVTDDMRRMRFADAGPFHDRLVAVYTDLGYELVEVPRMPIDDRANVIAARVGIGG